MRDVKRPENVSILKIKKVINKEDLIEGVNIEIKKAGKRKTEIFLKRLWKEFGAETGYHLKKKNYYYFVFSGKKRIGVIYIMISQGVAYLRDLILKSESRNKKIGHKLMGFFDEFSKKHKCHKMRIKTCPEINKAAYHLYRKSGFGEEAILKNDYFNKDWVILSKFIVKSLKMKGESESYAKQGSLGEETQGV